VQRVLDQVIRAVEFLFGFTLAAGLVVLFAAVTATREERAREFAIMRAVGAAPACCARCSGPSWWAWACWRAFWPVVAVGVGWALARYVFEFEWTVSPWVPAGRCAGRAPCWPCWPAGGACARCCSRPVVETLEN
jgi:putative ABC transport system permease protein